MNDQTPIPQTDAQALEARIRAAYEFRHATKVFDSTRKIPDAQLQLILDTGRLSPTSFGLEPWQMLVVQSEAARQRLHPHVWGGNGKFADHDGQLVTASHVVLFLAHTSQTMAAASPYLKDHLLTVKGFEEGSADWLISAYDQFQREHFDLTDDRKITDWSGKQAYIALGNMMTTAALFGVDSCPIEGFEQGPVSDILEEDFGIDPKALKPAVMVAFGYRAAPPTHPQTRRSEADVIRWV